LLAQLGSWRMALFFEEIVRGADEACDERLAVLELRLDGEVAYNWYLSMKWRKETRGAT